MEILSPHQHPVDLRSLIGPTRYNPDVLPDLQLNDHLRLRKPHPCGSYEWTVIRLGADIGLECKGCGRHVLLTRRELMRRLKTNLTPHEPKHDDNSESE